MNSSISLVLSGIGGYGNSYVAALLDSTRERNIEFVGAVDPAPASCEHLVQLKARGVHIYPSLDAFFADNRADLAIISSPLHVHAAQTCSALAHQTHVLCEKPLCATPDEARRMADAQKRAQNHVAIGYQWSYSRAIQSLKADIRAGLLGKPRRLRTLVLWPRNEAYYLRNSWAGRKQDSRGNWVLDSPVNNACAHHLHNMLFVLGDRADSSLLPTSLTAELYRAHAIENYDTAAIRFNAPGDIEMIFIVSHAIDNQLGPNFHFEFERATIDFADGPGGAVTARFQDGTVKNYGSPHEERMTKLWLTLDSIRQNKEPLCSIAAAAAHTHCVWTIQQSAPEICAFPHDSISADGPAGHRRIVVRGLGKQLIESYEQWKLPSEMGFDWARAGKTLPVEA